MGCIIKSFERAFEKKVARGWKHIYVFIDIHETIFKPTYGEKEENFEYYNYAKETLKMLTSCDDVILGLSTCSYPAEIAKYLDKFEEDGIHFDFINENPMEKNNEYACFDQKPYFNVLIEDKAGFEPNKEWHLILKYIQKLYLIQIIRLDEELGLYDDDDLLTIY